MMELYIFCDLESNATTCLHNEVQFNTIPFIVKHQAEHYSDFERTKGPVISTMGEVGARWNMGQNRIMGV